MAEVTNALLTYNDTGTRESVVLNAIELLTAQESQISNMIGKSQAINTIHSYLTETLRTVQSRAVEEGSALTAIACGSPTRLTNIVQEIAIPFTVSRPQSAVAKFYAGNELAHQTQKALKDFGNALEFDVVRSTLVTGVSGTAAKMKGVIQACSKSTNHTSHSSGTTFAASILDGLMKANWDNSNGDVATDLFVGSFLRNVVDGFTAKSNVVVAGSQTTLVRTVSVYESSFGTLALHTHRYIQISGTDATGRVLALRPEKLALAWLSMPEMFDLARTGAYDAKTVYGAVTVEVHNQDSNWFADGFDID